MLNYIENENKFSVGEKSDTEQGLDVDAPFLFGGVEINKSLFKSY